MKRVVAARRSVLGALTCVPFLAFPAAPPAKKRLAFLTLGDGTSPDELSAEVIKALAERGYTEGRRLEVLRAGPGGDLSKFDERAGEIVAWRPDAIVTDGSVATAAMQRATRVIPIVATVADPVEGGFAKSLAKPGGNITGLSQGLLEVEVKVMEIAKLFVPRLARIAIFRVDFPALKYLSTYAQKAARSQGIEPEMASWNDVPDAIRQVRGLAAKGIRAAHWIGATGQEDRIIPEVLRARLPMITMVEELAELGMLASLNSEQTANAQRMAAQVEQIFSGADPAQMPFQYPDRFRFVVNRRTAGAIGVKLTPEILVRADRVIE